MITYITRFLNKNPEELVAKRCGRASSSTQSSSFASKPRLPDCTFKDCSIRVGVSGFRVSGLGFRGLGV